MTFINKKIKKAIIKRILIFISILFISFHVYAQKDTIKVLYPKNSIKIEDSIKVGTSSENQYDLLTPDDTHKRKELERITSSNYNKIRYSRDWSTWKPNPKRALWLALVIPGAGQVYNRKYWKLPIFYGGFAGCLYALTWNSQMYHDYAQAYKDIMDNNENTHSYDQFLHLGNKIDDSNISIYQNIFKKRKDKYRRWRDLSIFATIGVYALSVIDAYVDAALSDFDISDDLSLHISPTIFKDNSLTTPNQPFSSSAIGIFCKLRF